jgi:hypothetical protein
LSSLLASAIWENASAVTVITSLPRRLATGRHRQQDGDCDGCAYRGMVAHKSAPATGDGVA